MEDNNTGTLGCREGLWEDRGEEAWGTLKQGGCSGDGESVGGREGAGTEAHRPPTPVLATVSCVLQPPPPPPPPHPHPFPPGVWPWPPYVPRTVCPQLLRCRCPKHSSLVNFPPPGHPQHPTPCPLHSAPPRLRVPVIEALPTACASLPAMAPAPHAVPARPSHLWSIIGPPPYHTMTLTCIHHLSPPLDCRSRPQLAGVQSQAEHVSQHAKWHHGSSRTWTRGAPLCGPRKRCN